MKPVHQKEFVDAATGSYGDCMRACVASLLELPLQAVPHFLQEAKGDSADYWDGIQTFLARFGLSMFTIPVQSEGSFFGLDEPQVFHILSGMSPRSTDDHKIYHAVVALNNEIVFDPHPSGAGLVGTPKDWTSHYLVRSCSSTEVLRL